MTLALPRGAKPAHPQASAPTTRRAATAPRLAPREPSRARAVLQPHAAGARRLSAAVSMLGAVMCLPTSVMASHGPSSMHSMRRARVRAGGQLLGREVLEQFDHGGHRVAPSGRRRPPRRRPRRVRTR
jgi:hypothetical protein